MTKELSIAELAALAAQSEDQTETQSHTFDDTPPPAGPTIGRFIEYIETGKHEQKDFQGKAKPPADEVRLTFELLHPKKNITEYEEEGQTKKRAQYVTVRLTKKLSEKAKFKKLFGKMLYGRDGIKHIAQMLGEGFLIQIYHNVVDKDGKKQTYVNIDKDGEYGIGAPYIIDPMTDTRQDLPIPENIRPLRIFLFDNPTKATWDSLYIDGTREQKNADGSVEQVSKNWLQTVILGAVNFKGSALDAMLHEVGELPTTEEPVAEKPAEKPAEVAEKAPPKPANENAAEKAAPEENSADAALKALGLG